MPLDIKDKIKVFGSKSGRDTDKFKTSGLTPIYDVDFDVTYVKEAQCVLKMKKIYVSKINPNNFIEESIDNNYPNKDYHYVYVGEIKQYLVPGDEK